MSTFKYSLVLILTITIGVFAGFLFLSKNDTLQSSFATAVPLALLPNTELSAVAAVQAVVTDVETTNLIGDKKIIMRTKNLDDEQVYSFFLSDDSHGEFQFYTKTSTDVTEMLLPRNSYSPNDEYVFIQENVHGVHNFLLFKTSNEIFPNGQSYVNVTEMFNTDARDYVLKEVTGWAAPNLLIVYTTSNGSKGPSFWFDVTSLSFIQLY